MEPAIRDKQIVLILKNTDIRKNDIVVFHSEDYGVCIKRVLACENDSVHLENGEISVNGVIIMPYTCEKNIMADYLLKQGDFFVLGENYKDSIDSRDYGLISMNDIVGRVLFH